MNDGYIYLIIALLPLSACMLLFQVNPYNALVIRGILGASAALVYAVLGAADVALTEALVGTMLAITLYAIAVRSSMVMRIGVVNDESNDVDNNSHFGQLMANLRKIFDKYYLRLELVPYQDPEALEQALMDKEVHAACVRQSQLQDPEAPQQPYHTTIRIQRIYDIMQAELSSSQTSLTYLNTPNSEEKH